MKLSVIKVFLGEEMVTQICERINPETSKIKDNLDGLHSFFNSEEANLLFLNHFNRKKTSKTEAEGCCIFFIKALGDLVLVPYAYFLCILLGESFILLDKSIKTKPYSVSFTRVVMIEFLLALKTDKYKRLKVLLLKYERLEKGNFTEKYDKIKSFIMPYVNMTKGSETSDINSSATNQEEDINTVKEDDFTPSQTKEDVNAVKEDNFTPNHTKNTSLIDNELMSNNTHIPNKEVRMSAIDRIRAKYNLEKEAKAESIDIEDFKQQLEEDRLGYEKNKSSIDEEESEKKRTVYTLFQFKKDAKLSFDDMLQKDNNFYDTVLIYSISHQPTLDTFLEKQSEAYGDDFQEFLFDLIEKDKRYILPILNEKIYAKVRQWIRRPEGSEYNSNISKPSDFKEIYLSADIDPKKVFSFLYKEEIDGDYFLAVKEFDRLFQFGFGYSIEKPQKIRLNKGKRRALTIIYGFVYKFYNQHSRSKDKKEFANFLKYNIDGLIDNNVVSALRGHKVPFDTDKYLLK